MSGNGGNSIFSNWGQVFQDWLKELRFHSAWTTAEKNLLEPYHKILCVDDDKSFSDFMQRIAQNLNLQMDIVANIQQARRKIEENIPYRALIVDGHLPDGSGIEFISWVRKEKGLLTPISFITRIYQDAGSFRLLKESLKVEYVLDKPLSLEEAHELLIQLSGLMNDVDGKKIPVPTDDFLADTKAEYIKTITDKIERLEKLVLEVQQNPNLSHLQSLRTEVHKIAGSAGSYGYAAVTHLCKEMELQLMKQIELARKGDIDDEWLGSLDNFYTQIKLRFQL